MNRTAFSAPSREPGGASGAELLQAQRLVSGIVLGRQHIAPAVEDISSDRDAEKIGNVTDAARQVRSQIGEMQQQHIGQMADFGGIRSSSHGDISATGKPSVP